MSLQMKSLVFLYPPPRQKIRGGYNPPPYTFMGTRAKSGTDEIALLSISSASPKNMGRILSAGILFHGYAHFTAQIRLPTGPLHPPPSKISGQILSAAIHFHGYAHFKVQIRLPTGPLHPPPSQNFRADIIRRHSLSWVRALHGTDETALLSTPSAPPENPERI